MKVWRATYHSEDEGTIVLWAATQREIHALAREQTGTSNPDCFEIERVEIPLTRSGLITWLRSRVTHNNG